MDLPKFFIVGARPVMAEATEDGGMQVSAYDWATGDLVGNSDYIARITFPDGDVDEISKEEFDAAVERLRAKSRSRR